MSNDKYKQVKDTVYDSKVFLGLVNRNIVPSSFRVIQGWFQSTAVIPYTTGRFFPILTVGTNEAIRVPSGVQVVSAIFTSPDGITYEVDEIYLGFTANLDNPTVSQTINPAVISIPEAGEQERMLYKNTTPSLTESGYPYLQALINSFSGVHTQPFTAYITLVVV